MRPQILILFGFMLVAGPVIAESIQWEIVGGTFEDGGTFSGLFTYDAETNTFDDWSISVDGGDTALFPPLTLTPDNSTAQRQGQAGAEPAVAFNVIDSLRVLRFTPSMPLDSVDALVTLDLAATFNEECFNCRPARNVVTGVLNPSADLVVRTPEALSGNWFDPDLAGEGYNVLVTEFGTVVFYFGYGSQGDRLWLISEVLPDEIALGQPLVLEMSEAEFGLFDMPAPPEDYVVWGMLELTFNSCDRGRAVLDGVDGVKTANIEQLVGIGTLDCSLPLSQDEGM